MIGGVEFDYPHGKCPSPRHILWPHIQKGSAYTKGRRAEQKACHQYIKETKQNKQTKNGNIKQSLAKFSNIALTNIARFHCCENPCPFC